MPYLALLLTILLALPADAAGTAGVLRLQSQAGVEILWEGVALGETDSEGLLVIEGIPSGEYRLTLRKSGFHDLDTQVEMQEGVDLSTELFLTSVDTPTSGDIESQAEVSPVVGTEHGSTAHARKPVDASTSDASLPESSEVMAGPEAAKFGATPPYPSFLVAMVLLIALLAGTAVARLLSNRRKASTLSRSPSRPGSISADDQAPLFEETEHASPGFLEDLKRREQDFDDAPQAPPRRPEETIIEVEAVEITTGSPSTRG